MGSNNQLRARVSDSDADCIEDLADERDIQRTDAERVLVREGLCQLGYREEPTEAGDILLSLARRSGTVLGFVGLIMIGYSVFGPTLFGYVGYGLLLAGFAGIAGAEFAPQVQTRLKGRSEADAA